MITPNDISLGRKSFYKSGIQRTSNTFRRSLNQNSAFKYNQDIPAQNVDKIIEEQFSSITSTQSSNADQPDGSSKFVFGQNDENIRNMSILGWLI